jgi:RNA polymerase sigma-70 factor (ECF subfamily)
MHFQRLTDWETHLVQRAQAGEAIAFELLADSHRDSLRNLAMRMLRDSEDANDAVQEALVKAYRAIHSFQPGRHVLPWMMRICSNCCVDALRHRKQAPESLERHEYSLCDPSQSVEEGAENGIDGEIVRAAVERLPMRYRTIIFMRHFRQMEVCEIATELNKPEGTIKSWLFRARALLRKDLQVALGA